MQARARRRRSSRRPPRPGPAGRARRSECRRRPESARVAGAPRACGGPRRGRPRRRRRRRRPGRRLSVISCRTSRAGRAPSARRTAISCSRAAPRCSRRFATFEHTISSTSAAMPSITANSGPSRSTGPMSSTRAVRPRPRSTGKLAASRAPVDCADARAEASVAPAARRPNTPSQRASRSSRRCGLPATSGCIVTGIQRSIRQREPPFR